MSSENPRISLVDRYNSHSQITRRETQTLKQKLREKSQRKFYERGGVYQPQIKFEDTLRVYEPEVMKKQKQDTKSQHINLSNKKQSQCAQNSSFYSFSRSNSKIENSNGCKNHIKNTNTNQSKLLETPKKYFNKDYSNIKSNLSQFFSESKQCSKKKSCNKENLHNMISRNQSVDKFNPYSSCQKTKSSLNNKRDLSKLYKSFNSLDVFNDVQIEEEDNQQDYQNLDLSEQKEISIKQNNNNNNGSGRKCQLDNGNLFKNLSNSAMKKSCDKIFQQHFQNSSNKKQPVREIQTISAYSSISKFQYPSNSCSKTKQDFITTISRKMSKDSAYKEKTNIQMQQQNNEIQQVEQLNQKNFQSQDKLNQHIQNKVAIGIEEKGNEIQQKLKNNLENKANIIQEDFDSKNNDQSCKNQFKYQDFFNNSLQKEDVAQTNQELDYGFYIDSLHNSHIKRKLSTDYIDTHFNESLAIGELDLLNKNNYNFIEQQHQLPIQELQKSSYKKEKENCSNRFDLYENNNINNNNNIIEMQDICINFNKKNFNESIVKVDEHINLNNTYLNKKSENFHIKPTPSEQQLISGVKKLGLATSRCYNTIVTHNTKIMKTKHEELTEEALNQGSLFIIQQVKNKEGNIVSAPKRISARQKEKKLN